MLHPLEQEVYAALDEMRIPYARFTHEAAMTMAACEEFDNAHQAMHCKNLFLTNRQGNAFYLLLVAGDKPFVTKHISKQLGVSRLRFATAEELQAKLGLTPGSVSPMGLLHDTQKSVHVLLDRNLQDWPRIVVHPNVNTASIILDTAHLFLFLQACANPLTYVDMDGGDDE